MQINRCESDLKPGDKVIKIDGDGTQYTVTSRPYYLRWRDCVVVGLREIEDYYPVDKLRKVEEVGTDG